MGKKPILEYLLLEASDTQTLAGQQWNSWWKLKYQLPCNITETSHWSVVNGLQWMTFMMYISSKLTMAVLQHLTNVCKVSERVNSPHIGLLYKLLKVRTDFNQVWGWAIVLKVFFFRKMHIFFWLHLMWVWAAFANTINDPSINSFSPGKRRIRSPN